MKKGFPGAIKVVSLLYGFYFMATGLWPLVHIKSFMMVTGPKNDLWLVKTVGLLVMAIGGIVLFAGIKERVSKEVIYLALASSASLTFIDFYYVLNKVISPVYLLDAVVEILFIIFWIIILKKLA